MAVDHFDSANLAGVINLTTQCHHFDYTIQLISVITLTTPSVITLTTPCTFDCYQTDVTYYLRPVINDAQTAAHVT